MSLNKTCGVFLIKHTSISEIYRLCIFRVQKRSIDPFSQVNMKTSSMKFYLQKTDHEDKLKNESDINRICA